MKIYLVQGSSGAYSDHCTWITRAFYKESEAHAYAESLPSILEKLRTLTEQDRVNAERKHVEYRARWPHDPQTRIQPGNYQFEADSRACDEMREKYDPGFSSFGAVYWNVVETDLVGEPDNE